MPHLFGKHDSSVVVFVRHMCHILSMTKHDKEYEKFRRELIERIKARRKELALTQEDMEEEPYSINVRTYQRIENGETDIILKHLYFISKKLGMDVL